MVINRKKHRRDRAILKERIKRARYYAYDSLYKFDNKSLIDFWEKAYLDSNEGVKLYD